tara:strand:- start:594 stop:845 length:252 start_codon:yes stop_codon:yes gene_type:complete
MDEPKAWLYICDGDEKHPVITHTKQSWPNHEGGWWKEVPLYAQREWVGLTDDDEILAISNTMPYANRFEFARAIEAKLKEKNT